MSSPPREGSTLYLRYRDERGRKRFLADAAEPHSPITAIFLMFKTVLLPSLIQLSAMYRATFCYNRYRLFEQNFPSKLIDRH